MDSLLERKENIESMIQEIEDMLNNHPDRNMLKYVHEEELNRLRHDLETITMEIQNNGN